MLDNVHLIFLNKIVTINKFDLTVTASLPVVYATAVHEVSGTISWTDQMFV